MVFACQGVLVPNDSFVRRQRQHQNHEGDGSNDYETREQRPPADVLQQDDTGAAGDVEESLDAARIVHHPRIRNQRADAVNPEDQQEHNQERERRLTDPRGDGRQSHGARQKDQHEHQLNFDKAP